MSKFRKEIDVAAIVKLFGGKHQIVNDYEKLLRAVLTTKAVEKWIERKSVPASQLFNLKLIAEKRGIAFTVDEYLK